jgi:hypothetical protein
VGELTQGIRPEHRRGLYDPGVGPNPESDRAKAFSKCTQVGLVGAFAKIAAMTRNPLEKLIDIYIGFEISSIPWIVSRYYS